MTILETAAIVFAMLYLLCAFIWLAKKYDGLRIELDRTNFRLGAAFRAIEMANQKLTQHLEALEQTNQLTDFM